ncbi:M17 family metallopeptidase [Spiroplasma endosymbiont of Amphibalanus improvisus]|uniref:M17 family metallopeptidase n=1 Tax=Spiroplasma endosymbiont of Amphibalanus improvisus TaxID=3066327 RepID=UPI00313F27FD
MSNEITLKACYSDGSLNKFVIKKDGVTTFISNDKSIYLYLNASSATPIKVKNIIIDFIKNNVYDINIDTHSFKNNDDLSFTKAIMEGVFYAKNESYNLKTNKKEIDEPKINILSISDTSEIEFKRIALKYEYINFARKLQDTPPNILNSEKMAILIEAEAKKIPGLTCKILNKAEIEKNKMGLLLSVNAGSNFEPRVVVLEYRGNPTSNEKTALVGKGITFDTGGYSLKPASAMVGMKFDMSGAAIVSATALSLAKLKAKANFVSVACITDNRIGANATLPESVITSMNGKTVQIDNTDAEGRLVLADGITYAIRKAKATRVVDVATLTGAIVIALGHYMTGVFATDDAFYHEFEEAAKRGGEEIWRMPIHSENYKTIRNSPIADISNIGTSRFGGSSSAAAFLDEFTEGLPFVHLDIAGTSECPKTKRGTGIMVKSLIELLFKG